MGDKEQRDIFKRNLIYYVDHCGHSQKEIAEAIGVSPQTFNTWMRGIALPRMGKVELLASFFHIRKSDLIDEHEYPTLLEAARYKTLFDAIRGLSPQHLSTVEIMVNAFKAEELKEKEADSQSSKEA